LQLDSIVSQRAREYAERISDAAARASKEEEIRIASERELASSAAAAGITLEGKHEFTVASGRVEKRL